MTNEERIEERLMHAHERGYYKQVIDKVNYIKLYNPKIDHYQAFEIACDEFKNKWAQNKEYVEQK